MSCRCGEDSESRKLDRLTPCRRFQLLPRANPQKSVVGKENHLVWLVLLSVIAALRETNSADNDCGRTLTLGARDPRGASVRSLRRRGGKVATPPEFSYLLRQAGN
jgi:hypothetical protein